MYTFLAGLLLGLALISPIGVQNLFVLNHGIRAGLPRILPITFTISLCDTALILLGALGASALLATLPGLREVLIVVGIAFLLFLGLHSLRTRPEEHSLDTPRKSSAILLQAIGVSLLNPHAILDTVGVVGGAIAAQAAGERLPFAAGAITASWLWFLLLGGGAAILKRRLTPSVRLGIQRASGLFMIAFATILALELFQVQ